MNKLVIEIYGRDIPARDVHAAIQRFVHETFDAEWTVDAGGQCSLCGGTGIVPGTEEPETNTTGEPCDCVMQGLDSIRRAVVDAYGTDYDDEDVPAAVERLMRHLGEHEANVLRLRQSKNEALVRVVAERDALLRHDKEIAQQLNAAETELTATQKQRDALKAAIEALAERWENALGTDRPYARDVRRILAASETSA